MGNIILLTGAPGSGKTTAIREILRRIPIEAGGFYTAEIREGRRRVGFRIITLAGQEGVMSHVNFRSRHRVGRYGVDLSAIAGIAVKSLRRAMQEKGLVVIDEIGPMELLSEAFRQVVMDILESEADVLGSIVRRSIPFSDEIKKRPGVRVIEIHPGNREAVVGEIAAILGGEGHD